MRGSALRAPAGRVPPHSPRGLAGAIRPVHPDQEGGLAPSLDHPASGLPRPDTGGQRVRPFGIRVQGALLPETPASKGGTDPFPPYPRRCVAVP
jgi:hypothetical protein